MVILGLIDTENKDVEFNYDKVGNTIAVITNIENQRNMVTAQAVKEKAGVISTP
jgi:YD repeat-containing protein